MSFVDRLQHAWNVFTNKDELISDYKNVSMTYSYRPDRPRLTRGNERSIVTSVFNRISTDASSINIRHIKLDENERYIETIDEPMPESRSKYRSDRTSFPSRHDYVYAGRRLRSYGSD